MPVPAAATPRPIGWRVLVPVTAAAAGLLLVTSAVTARGTDLRSSRTQRLGELVQRQQRAIDDLTRQAAALRSRIATTTAQAATGSRRVRREQAAADRLAPAAGLTPVRGPAVTVSLDDVPQRVQHRDLAAGARPDDLVIHQQDVQGVVNALWTGGAEAMTIMGQRVIATTAVRCVGNTLLLEGQVYSPPFVVTAIGKPAALRQALAADPDVQVFQQYVAAYGLRYRQRTAQRVTLPAYAGGLALSHAEEVS